MSGYNNNIVIGGSIRSGATSAGLQNFIKGNKDQLREKVQGYFAVCGNMQQPVASKQTTDFIDNHLAKLCEARGLPSRVFLGRVTKSLMDAETAALLDAVAAYDNLKRTECMAFGGEVLGTLAKCN